MVAEGAGRQLTYAFHCFVVAEVAGNGYLTRWSVNYLLTACDVYFLVHLYTPGSDVLCIIFIAEVTFGRSYLCHL